MRQGVRLGIDVGRARVGIARSTPDGQMAVPVVTLDRQSAVSGIVELVAQWQPVELVVGLPINLQGKHTASTEDAESFAQELAEAGLGPIRMVDERLSTVSAQAQLRASGKSSKKQRPVIDQVAAVILLQQSLDTERLQGVPPGVLVTAH
jgi:putative holliday junction resolvase